MSALDEALPCFLAHALSNLAQGEAGAEGQSHISCQVESSQCSCWLGMNVGGHLWLSEQLFGRGPDKAHHGLEAGGQLGGQYILA